MLNHLRVFLVASFCGAVLTFAPSAVAQTSNLDTVEGPNPGEETTLTITPHRLTDDVSARALGIDSPTDTRWALTLIGVSRVDSIGLTLGGEALPIEDMSRPDEDEVGPTRVFLSQKTFLTIAETEEVRLHIGDTTTQLPDQMRKDMRQIFEEVV